MINCFKTGGVPNSSKFSSRLGIWRRAMATQPRSLKIDTRKRAISPKAKPKSAPPTSWSSRWHRSGEILFISAVVSSGSRTLVSSRIKWPSTRMTGGCPTAMCKSLAFLWTTVCSNLSISSDAIERSPTVKSLRTHLPAWGTPRAGASPGQE